MLITRFAVSLLLLAGVCNDGVVAQRRPAATSRTPTAASARTSREAWLRLMQLEDERRWSNDIAALMNSNDARVREAATLAAGRIGARDAAAALTARLQNDTVEAVRAGAAFALGECEAATDEAAHQALIAALASDKSLTVRARAVEAIGKIAAALPESETARKAQLAASIVYALTTLAGRTATPALNGSPSSTTSTSRTSTSRTSTASRAASNSNRRSVNRAVREAENLFILQALTAALRARPAGASAVIAKFLASSNADVRATAANTLARVRAKDANESLRVVLNDQDADVRANTARALGAGEDVGSVEALINLALNDADVRVRVSAVRALSALRAARALSSLAARFDTLATAYLAKKTSADVYPSELNELFELAGTISSLAANSNDENTVARFNRVRVKEAATAPELEIALARVAPNRYLRDELTGRVINLHIARQAARPFDVQLNGATNANRNQASIESWRALSSIANGLAEVARFANETGGNANLTLRAEAIIVLRRLLENQTPAALAVPDVLRALAAFKAEDADATLRRFLLHQDLFVRATAAELISRQPASADNFNALLNALPAAIIDARVDATNDAALAIIAALARFTDAANVPRLTEALRVASGADDYLIRRRAIEVLTALNPQVLNEPMPIKTKNTGLDYQRAYNRRYQKTTAIIETTKGTITLELLPLAAPMTVDNFINLARANFFNNLMLHRVVPNFVVQDGDSRGDGNGAPPYQIRCEINTVPYTRGAVGMALSGKDTGGSQWFITHSLQPHLDGGYTVFARVIDGMNAVDALVRGDKITRVTIREAAPLTQRRTR